MSFSEEIIEVFNYLGEKMGVAIDWTSSTALPYVEELCGRYINWEIATSIAWIIIAFIAMIISMIINKKCDLEGFETILCVAAVAIGIYVIGEQIFDIIRCVYLPELQIYEYITTLMES